jgi:DNA-directed RNA polymerase subunit F
MVDKLTEFQQIADTVRTTEPAAQIVAREAREITRAVLQKIIDITPSPRTAEELTRILKTETLAEKPARPYNPSTAAL